PPPRWLPAAAHAWAAKRRARAAASTSRNRLHTRTHFVERGLAWSLAAGTHGLHLVIERDAHFIEAGLVDFAAAFALPASARRGAVARGGQRHHLRRRVVGYRKLGGTQPFDLVAQPCGFLEVEIGSGGPHARFQIGNHRFEIVADGGGLFELAA